MRLTALFAGLLLALASGMAHAQDMSPRTQTEINNWLEDASVFRTGAQDTARLWQRDAPLLDARTDIFVAEAAAFADTTETYAQRLRTAASGSRAAELLAHVANVMQDRLDALTEARAQGADNVVRVLGGMDHAVAEGLSFFGAAAEMQAQAEPAAPIRVAYVTEPS